MSKPEFEVIAESFLQQFFSNYSREHFALFYGNDSVLSVEKDKYTGEDIADKLGSISAQFKVSFHESQPSNNGILIFLSGTMVLCGESNPISFQRIFFLSPTQTGSLYVKNDMFFTTSG